MPQKPGPVRSLMQIVYKVQWFRDFNSKKSTESLGITKISIDENTGSRKKTATGQ
jgi:hypothetical protein